MRSPLATTLTLALVIGVSGCDPVPAANPGAALTQSDWTAETINGKPVIEPGRVTLSFVEDRVSGRSGCNLYSGPVEVANGTLKIGNLISTKMACTGDGIMQQESTYLASLEAAATFAVRTDGHLVISGPAGALVYTAAPRQQRPD